MPAGVWLPLFLVLGASVFWALDRRAAAFLAVRLILLGFAGLVLAASWRPLAQTVKDRLLLALGWGVVAAGYCVVLDLLFGGRLAALLHPGDRTTPLADAYSRGAVLLAIIAVPLAAALVQRQHRGLALASFLASVLAVVLGVQASATLALLVACVVALVVFALPALRWLVLGSVIAVALAAPFLPVQPTRSELCWLVVHKPSALHRLLIWDWVDHRIRERPLLGWGLDASRRMPGGQTHVTVRGCDDPSDSAYRLDNEVLPLHPHDAALQIWLELGALGAAAACFGLVAAAGRAFMARTGRLDAAATSAAFAAAAIVAGLSFGIWQEWWFAGLWIMGWIATIPSVRAAPNAAG